MKDGLQQLTFVALLKEVKLLLRNNGCQKILAPSVYYL